jgi:hypothetical protein
MVAAHQEVPMASEEVTEEILDENAPETTVAEDPDVLPQWARDCISPDLKIPEGRRIWVLKFKADWTFRPKGPDRTVVLWSLTDSEEMAAANRAAGSTFKLNRECAKQMIRGIDGMKADWVAKNGPNDVRRFWEEIGPKCRQAILNVYVQTHQLSGPEVTDFLSNCFAVGTAMPG